MAKGPGALCWNRLGRSKGLIAGQAICKAVKDPAASKPLLLFQDSRFDEFFSGGIYGMNYDKQASIS